MTEAELDLFESSMIPGADQPQEIYREAGQGPVTLTGNARPAGYASRGGSGCAKGGVNRVGLPAD